jgi:hypothetical protein
MGGMRAHTRPIILAIICSLAAACGGVDQKKFEKVAAAGKALQAEVESTKGAPTSPARDRLKTFDAEIDALHDHTIGRQEVDALKAYAEAADAYRYFLRFQALEPEEGTNQIKLNGPNAEVATRYKLPVDTHGGVRTVNRAQAVTILLQAAEQHLADGNRIVGRS